MNANGLVEVHFDRTDNASVVVETEGAGDAALYTELLLLSCFLLRQMTNLGGSIAEEMEQYFRFVDRSVLRDFNSGTSPNQVKIIPYSGSKGAKRFISTIQGTETRINFQLAVQGFGFFSRDINYFAPASALVLLRSLSKRREEDENAIGMLAHACRECAYAYERGAVKVGSGELVATAIVAETWKCAEDRAYKPKQPWK